MTQDEIIEMAKQAHVDSKTWVDIYNEQITVGEVRGFLIAFAKLVAEKEREACAQIAIYGCMVPPDGGSPTEDERLLCEHIAHSIRARGEA